MVQQNDESTNADGTENGANSALATAQETLGGTVVDTSSDTAVELWGGQRVTDEELRGLNSVDDVLALFGGGYVDAAQEFGTGFAICEDKDTLIKREFFIVDARVNPNGDFGPFASMLIAVPDGTGLRKLVVNDGSETGICGQLMQIMARASSVGRKPIRVAKGLRRSDYMKDLPDEKTGVMKPTPCKTYYLDLSA